MVKCPKTTTVSKALKSCGKVMGRNAWRVKPSGILRKQTCTVSVHSCCFDIFTSNIMLYSVKIRQRRQFYSCIVWCIRDLLKMCYISLHFTLWMSACVCCSWLWIVSVKITIRNSSQREQSCHNWQISSLRLHSHWYEYGLFTRVKLVQVECSQSLIQANTCNSIAINNLVKI